MAPETNTDSNHIRKSDPSPCHNINDICIEETIKINSKIVLTLTVL